VTKKFLRQDWMRHSKLGKRRKKIQKWRRPTGRHSKMREYRVGYPVSPNVGYRKPSVERGKIDGKKPILVYNLKDLEKADKHSILILAKIGAKNKMELIKKANEKGLEILNLGRVKNAAK